MRSPPPPLDELSINVIRGLAMDAVEAARSGHPGMPMGAATMAYVLWDRHLRHDPTDPVWPDRDRFVLSAGHGSMLLYALLHLTGYELPLEELREFRQWGSRTPGHPEYGHTPGVETTTGPLGQGFGNAVGMAIAERCLAARFNRPGHGIVDHRTYVIASDGDLMEGVQSEAASLAGHLGLGRLIVLYDANRISIDGSTDLAFTEDVGARFVGYGWHVQEIDGHDAAAVDEALTAARGEVGRPSLIIARTHIGYGSPNKQDSADAHGAPLGSEELRLVKERLGIPPEESFWIPEEVRTHMRAALERGCVWRREWEDRLRAYAEAFPGEHTRFLEALRGDLPAGWGESLPMFEGGTRCRSMAGACRGYGPSPVGVMAAAFRGHGPSPLRHRAPWFVSGGLPILENLHVSGRSPGPVRAGIAVVGHPFLGRAGTPVGSGSRGIHPQGHPGLGEPGRRRPHAGAHRSSRVGLSGEPSHAGKHLPRRSRAPE